MKKALFSLALIASSVQVASAGRFNMAGCGLGNQFFKDPSVGNQVLAATTNGIGSQTFAMSSGTSNCTQDGVAKIDREKEMFTEVNYEVLNKEMAQGKGETLAAFANVLGCDAKTVPTFNQVCQTKYKNVFSKATSSNELLNLVEKEVNNNPTLAKTCKVKG